MSTTLRSSDSSFGTKVLRVGLILLVVGAIFLASLAVLWFAQTPAGTAVGSSMTALFATDSVQSWWYVTRASGLTAYFLLWLSMVWGMAIPTKFFHPTVDGSYSYDFHEFLALLGLGFVVLHVSVLLLDKYLPFSLIQILVPFIDSYRPLWVGLGIMGFYIFLLVTVTFYIRKSIGTRAFRSIHLVSLLGYLGTTLHGLYAGTDSALPVTRVLYILTALVVVFLTVYWLVIAAMTKREKAQAAQRLASAQSQLRRVRPNPR